MPMKVFVKSQILMLTILALLLTVAPFLSPSFRSAYLYLVANFLIVALGAEAGLLSAFYKPSDGKKISLSVTQKPVILQGQVIHEKEPSARSATVESEDEKPIKVEMSASEKIVSVVKLDEDHDKVKKYRSLVPSLFFIGGGETEAEDSEEEEYDEEEEEGEGEGGEAGEGPNGQELSAKADAFIGNFYEQLKMQRQKSWKRINGIYQKGLEIDNGIYI